ncbi:hypothetical protein H1P_180005 [Hyella patelloides LEGE 07179]|uniref:Uncharacterized protein n=1 Tax=Hyella patelloides LEGE 07179 TaxID=945734 RepID=A0A563VNW5_9CYAN|nr:hypothetical protein H1P_180005 [Hyella patelloides LEGE 07179]
MMTISQERQIVSAIVIFLVKPEQHLGNPEEVALAKINHF